MAQLTETMSGFDSRWCHWYFLFILSFQLHYGPGVDSASNRNEYQEYFLGGKGGRCLRVTALHLHVPTVLKSGNLNLLETSGPVQACNGLALLFFFYQGVEFTVSVVPSSTLSLKG
jgi:hypothetical protein